MFGCSPPHHALSPLEKGDHPELDVSDLLDEEGIQQYQSLIGSLQWAVSLGRMDIATAVMTMSSFRAAPRVGHLERVKRIIGYLSKMRHGAIRIRTAEPDFSPYGLPQYDWMSTVYGNVREEVPSDAPPPLGRFVTTSHYVDANLMHDMMTGKSVTGCIHFFNQTPIDAFTKKQATVETATYGSEFVAARTCTEQIIELRTLLRYLGVPLREQSFMFGDNQAVVKSSTIPEAKLHKRHTLLSFHRVREAIAARMIVFVHIDGRINPADILSKHWGHQQVWGNLKPLLFWAGDTIDTFVHDGAKKELEKKSETLESKGRGVSEIHRDPVTDTSQVTSAIRGSGLSRGPFLPNAEEVTCGHWQLAGEQASAGQDGHASRADAKPGGTRTVHLAERKFTGSKEIAYCGNVVNKEQIPKEGAKGARTSVGSVVSRTEIFGSLDPTRTGSFRCS
jgi:hypothetical protein